MTALTKVALYQHILKAAYQGSCARVSTRTGEMITKSSKLWWIEPLECTVYCGPPYHKHQNHLLILWDMAAFKVAEVKEMQLSSVRPFLSVVVTLNTTFL